MPNEDAVGALRRRAVHEAGHAVVAVDLGLPVKEVTVVSDGNAVGCCKLDLPVYVQALPVRRLGLNLIVRMACEAFAGSYFELLLIDATAFDPEGEWPVGSRHDQLQAGEMADVLLEEFGIPLGLKGLTAMLHRRVNGRPEIVSAIRQLAAALGDAQTMSGSEVEEVVASVLMRSES
jgi:hypothetical protein